MVGCGGWSKRKTLYGSDHCAGREDALLDPAHDAAKIRAFFVHPAWARRGIGSRILEVCEAAAAAAGLPPSGDGRHPHRSAPLSRPRLRRSGTAGGAATPGLVAAYRPHGQSAMRRAWLAIALIAAFSTASLGAAIRRAQSVAVCSGISLSASYVFQVAAGQGPGFRFVLDNRTSREIRLAKPVPSSSHWYARSHGRWLWRASNGGRRKPARCWK